LELGWLSPFSRCVAKFGFAERSNDSYNLFCPDGGIMINALRIAIVATAMMLANGCSDDRVVHVATQAADRQAEQNDTMAKLQQDVAGGTQQLVAADADARHEIVAVHHDLQTERSGLDTGWSALEEERKQIAHERRTESVLLPTIQLLGGLVLVVTLLGFS
jgi:hypothetical protein